MPDADEIRKKGISEHVEAERLLPDPTSQLIFINVWKAAVYAIKLPILRCQKY